MISHYDISVYFLSSVQISSMWCDHMYSFTLSSLSLLHNEIMEGEGGKGYPFKLR